MKRKKCLPQRHRATESGESNEPEKERLNTEFTEVGHRGHREEWETEDDGQPVMAVLLREDNDFAGFGVYGWERAARAGVVVF